MDFVRRDNLFGDDSKMDIDEFKRHFFPQYFHVEKEEGSDTEDATAPVTEEENIKNRLIRLE